jgi:hypothetical protein
MKKGKKIEAEATLPGPHFVEYDLKDDFADYEVLPQKDFFLKVRQGPGVSIPEGSIVRLSPRMAQELFHAGRIKPVGMSDGQLYELTKVHRIVNTTGEYENLQIGTRVTLTVNEALELLRQGKVKAIFEDEKGR